ncbi:MAG: hypothetical protein Q8R92_15860 [Deltaproteobacteria bacterium]|nr:hypothetical protein [Deltaproteobacteria bacterium]
MEWFIAEWPDGDWCGWDARHLMRHKSDDYIRARVLSWDEGYVPMLTIPTPEVIYVSVFGVARFWL